MMIIWRKLGIRLVTPRFLISLPSIQDWIGAESSCYVKLNQPWKISRSLIRISHTLTACTKVGAGINLPRTYLDFATWKKARLWASRFGIKMTQERGNSPQPMGKCLLQNSNASLLWKQLIQQHSRLPIARLFSISSIDSCLVTIHYFTNKTSRGRWRWSTYWE